MDRNLDRRDFLKGASAAAGVLALGVQPAALPEPRQLPYPEIGSQPYTPVADYPIRAKRFSEVTITDAFWKPKITTNAEVTIPFEASRTGEPGGGLSGNVLDPATRIAAALYENFKVKHPPFSGGERDAINCLQLYRATLDKKHLDLAKHYLDIRGLENSVNRSRHNQSYKPVLEQSEAVGHAVNCTTLMVSLADVGVLTGLRAYLAAAERMWADAVMQKMYVNGGV